MASKAIGFLNFKFGADLGGFERAMNKAQKKLKKFGKGVERTGKSLTTGLTLPIVALGAASLKTFADFEQGMLKVKAISGATDVEFKALTESAKELGSTTMFTASQVAELQLNLSKLGLTPTQINQSTESILNLAQATDSDLGQAATVTAKIMNAFGMEATDMTRITDVMADAFSSTALDMTKFETAMASVAPVAKMAGSDLEQTSAVLGVLVNNGVEASTAGTALRNIFLDLAKSGKTWDQAMGEINSSTNPLAVSMEMFGKRGANVATILAQSGVEIESLTQDFRDSTGEAKKMADIMDSGVAGSIRKMRSQLEGAAIELGEKLVPIFEIAIEKISKMVKWFTSLSDEQQKNIVKYGLIIAAIGPLLIIIGKMSIGLSALIPLFTAIGALIMNTLVPAFVRLFAVMLANPIIAITTGLALLTAGIYAYVTSSDEAAKAAQRLKSEEEKLNSKLQEKKELLDSIALKEKKGVEHAVELKKQETAIQERLNNAKSKQEENLIKAQIKLERLKRKLDEIGNRSYSKIVDGVIIPLTQQEIQKKVDAASNSILKQSKIVSKLQDKFSSFSTEKITSEIDKTTQSIENFQSPIDETALVWDMLAHSMSNAEDQFKGIVFWQTEISDSQKLLNAGIGMFGDVLTSSLDSALNSQENFFDVFIKNIKKAITSLLIQLAVLSLIKVMMGDGSAAFTLAGLKGSLGEIMNVKLAEGGLVTGPTTALIGEGVGTNAGNPEVVAPLDKLKSMMGGGSQHIEVTGKLVGNDIYLSNSKTGTNRERSV